MTTNGLTGLHIRKPDAADGTLIWNIVKQSKTLDVNSPYCYIMLSEYFANTCAIAQLDGKPAGAMTGYRPPERPCTLFVWQIAVSEEARGRGIGRKLIEHVLNRDENQDIRYVEATVSPSNTASKSLFSSFARSRGAACKTSEGFQASLFPGGAHEDEPLLLIGPIDSNH